MMSSAAVLSPRCRERSADPLLEDWASAEESHEDLDVSFGVPFADAEIDACQQVLAVERSGLNEASAPRSIPPLRVLLVDDNGLVAKLLAVLLRLDGHEVQIAESGFAALSCVPTYQPQVILLDINLPDMSGYEIASRLRCREDTKDIFLAAVTGYGRKEDGDEFRRAGFDCHLAKPVDAGDLRRLLTSVAHGRNG